MLGFLVEAPASLCIRGFGAMEVPSLTSVRSTTLTYALLGLRLGASIIFPMIAILLAGMLLLEPKLFAQLSTARALLILLAGVGGFSAAGAAGAILGGTREIRVDSSTMTLTYPGGRAVFPRKNVLRPIVLRPLWGLGQIRYEASADRLGSRLVTLEQARMIMSLPDYTSFKSYSQFVDEWRALRGRGRRGV